MAAEPAGSARSKVLQFRVNPTWLRELDQNLRQLKTDDDDDALDRSSFARDLISVENAFLRTSPYVATDARHFMLVTGQGHLLYRRREVLRLNNELEEVPSTLALSAVKRDHFSSLHDGEIARAWLVNNHALWTGSEPAGDPLASESDDQGADAKSVRLSCCLPAGAVVLREGCFALEGYAQTSDGGDLSELYDRVDVLVDVPTRALEMLVAVDCDLYSATSRFGKQFQPELSFEISNREQVPFVLEGAQKLLEEPRCQRLGSCYPLDGSVDAFYQQSVDRIETSFSDLKKKLGELLLDLDDDESAERAVKTLKGLKMPKDYLFYRVNWAWPHIGLFLSVKWPKPQKA